MIANKARVQATLLLKRVVAERQNGEAECWALSIAKLFYVDRNLAGNSLHHMPPICISDRTSSTSQIISS